MNFSVLILTFNEAIHIQRCLENILQYSDDIVVLDSYSNDNTQELCANYPVRFIQNSFVTHSKQVNYALENINFEHEILLRLDADEIVTTTPSAVIRETSKMGAEEFSAGVITRRMRFCGDMIKFGGWGSSSVVRFIKLGRSWCRDVPMDEHFEFVGKSKHLDIVIEDNNTKGMDFFLQKHALYAEKEAIRYLNDYSSLLKRVKMHDKRAIYYSCPAFLRPVINIIFVMYFKNGHKEDNFGLIFHLLQAFWYRLIVEREIVKVLNDDKVNDRKK